MAHLLEGKIVLKRTIDMKSCQGSADRKKKKKKGIIFKHFFLKQVFILKIFFANHTQLKKNDIFLFFTASKLERGKKEKSFILANNGVVFMAESSYWFQWYSEPELARHM